MTIELLVEHHRSPNHKRHEGFSLAEVLLAIGLVSIALLALVAQGTVLVGASQKQENRTAGIDVARSIIAQEQAKLFNDASAFSHSSVVNPLSQGIEQVGATDYNWELYLIDIADADTGEPVGTGPAGAESSTKLKRMEVRVSWWNQDNPVRQGVGKLETRLAQLVRVRISAP